MKNLGLHYIIQAVMNIACNEVKGFNPEYRIRFYVYPERSVAYCVKHGLFKIVSLNIHSVDNRQVHDLTISDLDVTCDVTNKYGQAEYELYKAHQYWVKHQFLNKPITTRTIMQNDLDRYELSQPYPERYEKVSLEDSCTFELFVQSEGYSDYTDWAENHMSDEDKITDEAKITAEDGYNRFYLERCLSQSYADGKDVEFSQ